MSNRYMQERWSWIDGTHTMRIQLLDTFSDADLAFTPGGQNITLGALCRELGEVEYSYLQSLHTFTQDWTYRNSDPALETSVASLKNWYAELDADMKATVEAFSDEDLAKTIDRGGWAVPVETQLDVYLQALLIFFGKVSVYVRAMDRALPGQMVDWIG